MPEGEEGEPPSPQRPQDSKADDSAAEDPETRATAAKASRAKDPQAKDVATKDGEPRDAEPPKDADPKDAEPKDIDPKAAEPKDAEAEGEGRPGDAGGGRGRNLPVAVGVGLALGGMVLLSLYTVKEIFLGVMAVFLAVGLREMTQAFAERGIQVALAPVAIGLGATVVFSYAAGPVGLLGAVAMTTLAVLIWRMPGGADGFVRDTSAGLLSVVYLVLMGGLVALLMKPNDGDDRIVIFIAVTVASDIGGFFAGSYLGRHKMAPTISPKKTWEGFTGSALTCMLIGGWLVPWLLDGGHIWQGALLGAAVAFAATVGDLIESMIKRDLGVKDFGSVLPGHGGVMDRLDSLLATAPVVWLLLELFVPAD